MNHHKEVDSERIQQIISLLDLTNLNDDCDEAAIEVLISQARSPIAEVAAICVWPEFVGHAQQCLGVNSDIQIATVVNFPGGDEKLSKVCKTIENSLASGATEIDYVMPYAALLAGHAEVVSSAVNMVRKNTPVHIKLKVILETGVLGQKHLIQLASQIAVDEGADFIKTSTGKVLINATLEAASVMLEVIAGSGGKVGFKASGGIRTVEQAIEYLQLSDKTLGPDWATTSHFRFGASGLLQDALARIDTAGGASGISSDY